MQSNEDILSWRGRDVVDRDGDSIGSLEEIYLDAETDEPTWAAVKTGMFGTRSTFVPIRGAQLDGDRVRVAHEKSHIKDAPNVESDGELSPAEEDRLYDHYDVAGASSGDARDGAETGATRSEVTGAEGGTVGDRDRDRETVTGSATDTSDESSGTTERDRATDTDGDADTVAPASPGDERATEAAPTGGTGGAVTGGRQDSPITSAQGRRPRIRRVITEEVDEAGQVTKRETTTEETFS
jgi:hypothetical protein